MRSDEPGFVSQTPAGPFASHDQGMTAAGTTPDRATPPDDTAPSMQTGIPGVGTAMSLSAQTGPGEGSSPQLPGQNDASVIAPGPAQEYTSTGASGSSSLADHWPRKPGQQLPGGGTA